MQFSHYTVDFSDLSFAGVENTSQKMNVEKLKKLQQNVRIGGKGSVRRKYKGARKTGTADDKKIQATLKRLGTNPIPEIQEVNFFREDNKILHFANPRGEA